MLWFLNCTVLTSRKFDARLSLFNFRCLMYSLQIHKQANRAHYQVQFQGNQNVLTSECGHLPPALINFKQGIFRPMPAINGGHRLSCCCARRRSCRRGGALCWECPSAAGRASARRWTGWSVSWSEQRPGDRAGGGKRAPHTPCRCGGRASPTLVRHLCHILLSARMLPHAHAQITRT